MEHESNRETEMENLDLSQFIQPEPQWSEEMPEQVPENIEEYQDPGAVDSQPEVEKTPVTAGDVWQVTKTICRYIYKFRAIFLAIPVVVYMIRLAKYGWANLPAEVGLMISKEGGFEFLVTRDQAVWGCVAVPSACLAMMLCSRKKLYPWLVAVVSLLLPVLILYVNLVLIA